MENKRTEAIRRAGFRMLRKLGQVNQELHQLSPQGDSPFPQLKTIEFELICNAIDFADMCSGLPGWEDRLSFIRQDGIDISPELMEGFSDVYDEKEV